jgi:rare lipoprotein A
MIRHACDLVIGVVLVLGVAFLFGGPPVRAAECAKASYYCCWHHGRPMANGRPFNQNAMTAAHRTLPLGTVVRATSGRKSVVVTITDRGPYARGRIIDLSLVAFEKLAPTSRGVIPVCVTRLR